MAPLSATEKQKLLLQQEIAKLSGEITRQATNNRPSSYHPYKGYPPRGGFRGKPRGRGRGGAGYSLDLRANRPSASSTSTASASASAASASEFREEGEVSPPPEAAAPTRPAPTGEGWVKNTSKRGNMSLMTVQKKNELAARPPPPRRPKVPAQVQVLQSTSESTPGGTEAKRVVIDGVIFQFEDGGKKLARIGELPSAAGPSIETPTRQSLNYAGERYRRTKRGNLMSRSSLSSKRAEQARKPCRYYTKTGRCDRALTCPYKHIPDRLAICPRFLRHSCPLGAEACPLSHSPSAHNTPSCVHFQATATCRNGDACLYPHVRVADNAPVCEAFAREGWCDREAGTCPELHIWECPEWHAKGTCSRGAKCGLRHVLRAEKDKKAPVPSAVLPVGGTFEDQADFIGVPGEVFSETESEEDEEEGEEEEESESESESEDDTLVSDQGKMSDVPMDSDDDEERVLAVL